MNIGPITAYGANAMHWGINIRTRRWGYVCFRLPFRCFGRWWPLYFYVSPNATPWAATFLLGRRVRQEGKETIRRRRRELGHNFAVNDDGVYRRLFEINGYTDKD
jgi:hypothetical protein